MLLQHREHVAVSHLRPPEIDTFLAKCQLESQICHHRADDGAAERVPLQTIPDKDIEELIAVDELTFLVHHQQSIAVTVECKPDVGAHA